MTFFAFDIIEIECEFDYSIFSEISPWAYFWNFRNKPMGLFPSIYGIIRVVLSFLNRGRERHFLIVLHRWSCKHERYQQFMSSYLTFSARSMNANDRFYLKTLRNDHKRSEAVMQTVMKIIKGSSRNGL